MATSKRIREMDISVLVHYPDDPDEGRGAIEAHDVREGEKVTELIERILKIDIKHTPRTVPSIKVELRVKARDPESEKAQ